MKKQLVIDIFNHIADILEIKGENVFKIRAYRRAAINMSSLSGDIVELVEKEQVQELAGIGKDLAEKITEIVNTGKLEYYDKIRKEIPQGVLDMLLIQGIGPRTTKLIYEKLNVKSIEQLEKLAKAHKISGLPGIKDKTEENVLSGIELIKKAKQRVSIEIAWEVAHEIINVLAKLSQVKKITIAGSLRRMKETVRDIDILVTSTNPGPIMKKFTTLDIVDRILAFGKTKSSIMTENNIQVDLRVVSPKSFGAALCYLTGSKAHNVHLRRIAKLVGLKLNEYGIFREKNNKFIAGKEETDVYKALDLAYVEPEMREDSGEIEIAHENKLPKLVKLSDIKGDLHMHTTLSDGAYSIPELVKAAKKRGYKYIAITDHSESLGVAHGVKRKNILKQIEYIRDFNKKSKNFKILTGCELEIKSDGSVDYDEEVLSKLDIVIAAIHTGFKQSREKMTERIIKGLSQSQYINVFAHPTGRLINKRHGYEVDLERIMWFCTENNIFIEINSYPLRLDLNDAGARRAKQLEVGLIISTDTHKIEQLEYMKFGVGVARRGWAEKNDILNTGTYQQVLKKLQKRRKL